MLPRDRAELIMAEHAAGKSIRKIAAAYWHRSSAASPPSTAPAPIPCWKSCRPGSASRSAGMTTAGSTTSSHPGQATPPRDSP
jgi:hypothetical protein